MGEPVHLDVGLAPLYAQALIAIARADGRIGLEEGLRLQERLDLRCGAMPIDDLLLEDPLDPDHLASIIQMTAAPFRGGRMNPGEFARMIVVDAIAVVLAKGHVAEREAHQIIRFATALGCSVLEVRAMSRHLTPWLGAIR